MRRVRADLATRPGGTRSVVMAHAFVAGLRAERLRARHQRRRGLDGVLVGLRRRRLRRARSPPRTARARRPRPLQRLAAGLLVLRGRPAQGLLAGRPRRGRLRRGGVRRGTGAAPAGRAARRPRLAAVRPHARRPRGRLGPGHADRRPASASRPWRGCASASPTPSRSTSSRPRPPSRPRRRRAARAAATTTSPSTSSPTCAASRPPTPSPRCSVTPCDACCDDPDVDARLTEAATR